METHPSPWRGRRVLVTGCTGFLGSAVTRELLARGADVVGLVRDRSTGSGFERHPHPGCFRPVRGRVEDAARLHAALAVHEVSAVFHLAKTNTSTTDAGTSAVLRAAGLYHPQMPVVVARPVWHLRLTGRDEPVPVPLGVARFRELFGGGDRNADRVVSRTAFALAAGEPVPLAPPTAARDFVYVRDAARACLAVAEAAGACGHSLDLTFRSGWAATDREMADLVADAFDDRLPADTPDAPANPLGWQPEATLAEALRETAAWYRERAPARLAGAPRRRAA